MAPFGDFDKMRGGGGGGGKVRSPSICSEHKVDLLHT